MKNPINLTSEYQQVSVADFMVCVANAEAEVYVGSSTTQPPSDTRGLPLSVADTPHQFSNIALLGGNVWVKGTGMFFYASDS